jgi:peptidoglycan/xylan/chitin deacetylase (PgdA/CDA1 family)
VPAATLSASRTRIKPFIHKFEWGLHGYEHVDYSALPKDVQERHLAESREIFESFGIGRYGFRAPYGKTNRTTLELLQRAGISYDSSPAFMDPSFKAWAASDPAARSVVEAAESHYDLAVGPRPSEIDGLMRIPFTLPDDEILIDRLNFSPAQAERAWSRALEGARTEGRPFVLQLHPLRIRALRGVLDSLLDRARGAGLTLMTLGDLADRARTGAAGTDLEVMCVTGDVDAMHFRELMR